MSEGDSKLLAILKSFEGAEHAALRERAKVLQVFEQREGALKRAQERQEKLRSRLLHLRGAGRFSALHAGELGSVRAGAAFGVRLEGELREVESEVHTLVEDVRRAQERVTAVDEEVIQARIDRKRIETLLENREQARRVVGVHVEEVQAEELQGFKRKEKR
jgi:hypothetical protein